MISEDTVVMPGVFNGISAVSAHKAGARALYLSGAGITNAALGVPDIALATLTEFAQQAAYVTQVAPVPVLSDADTGFGEALNVARTVIEMERAGLAGIHLEDQISPKRCGHLDGKSCIEPLEMARKIRAAVDSKRDPSFMIVARTDARGVEGLDSAIERARRYEGAGADAIFPEGLTGEAEFEAFRGAVSIPLLANMTEFGKTPIIPVSRFRELGYGMVIFPMTAFRVMLRALDETYAELLSTGTQAGILDRMRTRAELYDRIDYAQYDDADRRWSGN
ncbi:2-methylisocitrate lyase [Fimbriimonas ginsengisoli Gsoil 348]|uniref:Methylisocitrate lyase n=2 Tax=Fimbriimonas ginsengisoli TaxID=1005039 RepID=A0A068NUC0_FIMGI|nr:2-methylisocitrate lyase [Fimbriimonas ginsengisoli Gsoil 348]